MNPFIDVYQDPVVTLTAIGWASLLMSLIWLTSVGIWRNVVVIRVRWTHQRPTQWEYIPPGDFILRVAAIPTLLWIDAWALAAFIWILL